MAAELFILEPKKHAQRFLLDKQEFVIGRDEGNDLVIDENKVSKHHAKIFREHDAYFIQDLNSKNGTFVNQRRVTKVKLLNKAEVRIGGYIMTFSDGHAETVMMTSPFKESGPVIEEQGAATLIEGQPSIFQFDSRDTTPSYMPDVIQKKDLARLYVITPDEVGSDYLLDREEIFMGTDEESDIVIKKSFVSRRHCKILKLGEEYTIIDLNSTNGLFVNGKKVKEKKLTSGDQIGVGQMSFRFSDRGEIFSPFLESKKKEGIKIPVFRIILLLLIFAVAGGAYFMYSTYTTQQKATQSKIMKIARQNKAFYDKAEELFTQQKWEEALDEYKKITPKFRLYDDVKVKMEKTNLELQHRQDYYRLLDAIEKKDFSTATTLAATIPPDSWFQVEAMKKLADTKNEYLLEMKKQGSQQMTDNLWDEAINTFQTALGLDPENPDFVALLTTAQDGKTAYEKSMDKASQQAQSAAKYRNLQARANRDYTNAASLYQQGKIPEAIALLDGIAKIGLSSKEKILANAKSRRELIDALDGFYKAGQGFLQQGSQQDAITKWEEMLQREKGLSLSGRSTYAQEVSTIMADYYASNGDLKFRENKFPLAYDLWSRALAIDPTNKKAKNGHDQLNTKAMDLYREGYSAAGYNNIDRAKKLWQEVLTIVPESNEYYKKSQEKLIEYEK